METMLQNHYRIFVVEDDKIYGKSVTDALIMGFQEYEVSWYKSGKDCLDNLHLQPHIITLDYNRADKMPSEEILHKIHDFNPEIPVVIISGQRDVKVAVKLLKEGAYDYIVKDHESIPKLLNLLGKIQEKQKLLNDYSTLKQEVTRHYSFRKIIIGNSKEIQEVFFLMEKSAGTKIITTITGETGTGKDLVAKAIHYNSFYRKGPFIIVNMAAIPSELIESELFGHEKGAFTGALTRRIGKFELANNGTIFLDEIAEMPLNLQSKLLRVLQDKEITRIGGNNSITVKTRIIVATNKNLEEEVQKGNFREDLYYRLLGFPIHIPPLRNREDDCLVLAKYFLDDFCKQNELNKMTISVDAQNSILSYNWPGNVRELKAIIERAAVMTNDDMIHVTHLNFSAPLRKDKDTIFDEKLTMEDYKFKILRFYLQKYDNNIDKVSRILKMSKATIYRMLKLKPVSAN